MAKQRRGQVIAMSTEELDVFLSGQHTCRVATVGSAGPHVAPVWFVWDGQALWIYSLTRSQRWANLSRDPRVAVVIDDGHHYHELRGVEIEGEAAVIGPVPRTGAVEPPVAELGGPERLMAAKYFGQPEMAHDGRHAWLRIIPAKIVSWDFRKLATLPGRPDGTSGRLQPAQRYIEPAADTVESDLRPVTPRPAAGRSAAGGMLPSLNMGGLVSQPAQLLTSLSALENTEQFGTSIPAADPINVIRVRVAGVHRAERDLPGPDQ